MKVERIKKDKNPLINSYLMGDISEFRQLIKDGEDVNCFDDCGNYLIDLVVSNKYALSCEENNKFFDTLMENNLNINSNKDSIRLLYLSIIFDNKYIFKKLINKTMDINLHDFTGDEPHLRNPMIFHAIRIGKYYYLDLLLNKNLDINSLNRIGETILNAFIRNPSELTNKEEIEIFQRFIDLGADVNNRGYRSMQAIHQIAYVRKTHLLKTLLKENTNVELNGRDGDGNTALMLAVRNRNIDAIEILVENGALMNIHNLYGDSALSLSIRLYNDKIFNFLVKNNAIPLTINRDNSNILHRMINDEWGVNNEWGCIGEYEKYYKTIIKKHPELLFSKNKDGKTPIDLLIRNKRKHPNIKFFKNIINELDRSKINIDFDLSL